MNLISKLQHASDVPTPAAGYASTFIDILDNSPKVKLSTGEIFTLRGLQGLQGLKGETGQIISVSTETVPAGTAPSVENNGTDTEAELLFKFPQTTAIVGLSVEAVSATTPPSVENTGTIAEAELHFKLPVSTAKRKVATLDFSHGDTIARFTIADESVTPTSPPCGLSIYSPSTEGEDLEIAYSVNLVSVSNGSFVVTVIAYDPEGTDLLGLTLPQVTLSYLTGV